MQFILLLQNVLEHRPCDCDVDCASVTVWEYDPLEHSRNESAVGVHDKIMEQLVASA